MVRNYYPKKLWPNRAISQLIWLVSFTVILVIFSANQYWVLKFYSNGTYPKIAIALRWLSSIFPFAIGDIIYALFIILVLAKTIISLKNRKALNRKSILILLIKGVNLLLILYIAFKLLWGLNYSRPNINEQLKISNDKYSVKELVLLGDYFIDKLNRLQPKLSPNLQYNIKQLREKAVIDYQNLAQQNAFFSYHQPSVKQVTNGWLISKIGIEGYYNPLSGEANINMALPAWVLPFVTCHEIAHQIGVAKEDEANLVAYLVAKNSKDVNFQYSANYNMLRYILVEIRLKSPEDYIALREKIDPAVLATFKAENDFWVKYNGEMSTYMGVAFDKFLKLNNQKKGIDSYQDIVIWLWNIHKKEIYKL